MKYNTFEFNGQECSQISGLSMGSLLSSVGVCLFMELLEERDFLKIFGENSLWLRCVDDVLVVVSSDFDLSDKLNQLNSVEPKIKFIVEREKDQERSFLDTLIMRDEEISKLEVYRKPTSKEDYIHFFCGHSKPTKSGVLIGFFLRGFQIFPEEYRRDEI